MAVLIDVNGMQARTINVPFGSTPKATQALVASYLPSDYVHGQGKLVAVRAHSTLMSDRVMETCCYVPHSARLFAVKVIVPGGGAALYNVHAQTTGRALCMRVLLDCGVPRLQNCALVFANTRISNEDTMTDAGVYGACTIKLAQVDAAVSGAVSLFATLAYDNSRITSRTFTRVLVEMASGTWVLYWPRGVVTASALLDGMRGAVYPALPTGAVVVTDGRRGGEFADGDIVASEVCYVHEASVTFMHVGVKTPGDEDLALYVHEYVTAMGLKARLEDVEGIAPHQQRLVWAGKQLADTDMLVASGIATGAMLHLMLRLDDGWETHSTITDSHVQ